MDLAVLVPDSKQNRLGMICIIATGKVSIPARPAPATRSWNPEILGQLGFLLGLTNIFTISALVLPMSLSCTTDEEQRLFLYSSQQCCFLSDHTTWICICSASAASASIPCVVGRVACIFGMDFPTALTPGSSSQPLPPIPLGLRATADMRSKGSSTRACPQSGLATRAPGVIL